MRQLSVHDELKALITQINEIDTFDDADNVVTHQGVDSILALEISARIEKR